MSSSWHRIYSSGVREAEQDWCDWPETEGSQQDQPVSLHIGQRHLSIGGRPLYTYSIPQFQAYQATAGLPWWEFQDCHGMYVCMLIIGMVSYGAVFCPVISFHINYLNIFSHFLFVHSIALHSFSLPSTLCCSFSFIQSHCQATTRPPQGKLKGCHVYVFLFWFHSVFLWCFWF